jgi:hypothetical protein
VPKVKPDHRSVGNTLQFLKQFPDLPLQLELIKRNGPCRFGPATETRDAYEFEIRTDDWLPHTDWNILNSSELVLLP